MYTYFIPADLGDMENLGCTAEFWYGEGEQAVKYESDKICSFYVPAGVAHGPLIIKNLTKPCYLVHSTMAGEYKTWRDGKDDRQGYNIK